MSKRIPVLPTLIVLVAVAVMLRLGFWQLNRLHQKEALIESYAAAVATPTEVVWPKNPAAQDQALFRRSAVNCHTVKQDRPVAGRSAKGGSGWSHVFSCAQASGGSAIVVLGWSADPAPREFKGGLVTGTIAPGGRLIADGDFALKANLQPNAKPDPKNIPNNHFAYAVQWFLFAGTALVIYVLAVRRRLFNRD